MIILFAILVTCLIYHHVCSVDKNPSGLNNKKEKQKKEEKMQKTRKSRREKKKQKREGGRGGKRGGGKSKEQRLPRVYRELIYFHFPSDLPFPRLY